jgi:hypothetical protein
LTEAWCSTVCVAGGQFEPEFGEMGGWHWTLLISEVLILLYCYQTIITIGFACWNVYDMIHKRLQRLKASLICCASLDDYVAFWQTRAFYQDIIFPGTSDPNPHLPPNKEALTSAIRMCLPY